MRWDLPVPYSDINPVAFETEDDQVPAGAGRAWLYVEPDGDVLPAQGEADKLMGNMLTDPWEKIIKPPKPAPASNLLALITSNEERFTVIDSPIDDTIHDGCPTDPICIRDNRFDFGFQQCCVFIEIGKDHLEQVL